MGHSTTIALEKRRTVRKLVELQPDIQNKEIEAIIKKRFGGGINGRDIKNARNAALRKTAAAPSSVKLGRDSLEDILHRLVDRMIVENVSMLKVNRNGKIEIQRTTEMSIKSSAQSMNMVPL